MSSLERTLRRKMHRNKKSQFFREPEERLDDFSFDKATELIIKERQEQLRKDKAPLVWAKMIYICDDCGARFEMFLENTLERHNGKNHKPVPFMIRCRKCGGFHCYDRSFLIPLPEPRYLEDNEDYFADKKECDCGTPVIRSCSLTF